MRLSLAALVLTAGTLANTATYASSGTSTESFESAAARAVSDAAIERTEHTVRYNSAYRIIDYPNGDVPAAEGVCTDVVIRTYRALGIDLQQLVHEDMSLHFAAYPDHWGLSRPDPNIDHRRVPNLETFFERAAKGLAERTSGNAGKTATLTALSLRPSRNAQDYLPGDLVSWRFASGMPHIGVVVDKRLGNKASDRYAIVHNMGQGPELADVLFNWRIIGHYRYLPTGSVEQ